MGKMRELVFLDAKYFKDEAVDRVVDQWVKKTTGRLLVVRSAKKYWKDGLKPADMIRRPIPRSNFLVFTKSKECSDLFRDFDEAPLGATR
ncbi:hypothetical protein M3Y99_01721000 [Aphelenchoides fujianensis]|nr:hypothetical protein M3Y99_01721000 [Aphelenchoides fujianensis]